MTKTSNYNLNQWESADPIRREDFNENADIIDAALNSLNTAVGSKAEQSALNAVQTALGKAWTPDNVPWETGVLDLTGVQEGDVVKIFDFVPTAVFVGAVLYMTGFAINGGECRTRRHTTSDYYEFLLSGNTLQVNSLNGEPVTQVQYLALK